MPLAQVCKNRWNIWIFKSLISVSCYMICNLLWRIFMYLWHGTCFSIISLSCKCDFYIPGVKVDEFDVASTDMRCMVDLLHVWLFLFLIFPVPYVFFCVVCWLQWFCVFFRWVIQGSVDDYPHLSSSSSFASHWWMCIQKEDCSVFIYEKFDLTKICDRNAVY